MAAGTLPDATCPPALPGTGRFGFLVPSGGLHTLQPFDAAHADVSFQILDDGTQL